MKDQSFRFRAQAATGECSQDWRVWSNKNEVYVGARSTSREYKASFHSSGQCHVGFSQEFRRRLRDPAWQGKSRLLNTWFRDPADCLNGHQHLLELVFPHSHLDTVPRKHEADVQAIESRPRTILALGIYRARMTHDSVVQSDDPSLREIHRIDLPDGDSMLLITHELPETPEYLAYLRTRLLAALEAQPNPERRTYGEKPTKMLDAGVRALLWDGARPEKFWHEASARKIYSSYSA